MRADKHPNIEYGVYSRLLVRFGCGAKVVVSARSEPGLNSLVDEIHADGGEATAIVADVTVFEQVKAIADKAVEVYGRLDTWVHCPATVVFATFLDTTPEEFQRAAAKRVVGGTSV